MRQENTKFGKINLVENRSLAEIIFDVVNSLGENLISKNVATCLLTGLVMYYEDFKSKRTTAQIFHTAAELVKRGAGHQQIVENIRKITKKETQFFSSIFQNLRATEGYEGSFAILESHDFHHFGESEANFAIERIKTIGIQDDLLVLWKSHSSAPLVKGFFYSKKESLIVKVAQHQETLPKHDWVFLSISETDINAAKEKIMNLLS